MTKINIRGVSTVVGGQIDKVFDTSGLPNTGANEALNDGMDAVKGIIKMANEKAKDAATDANSSSNNN